MAKLVTDPDLLAQLEAQPVQSGRPVTDPAVLQQLEATEPAPAPVQAPDPYQQAAIAESEALRAQGVDPSAGAARLALQGATFNTADEILAAARTPLEMIRRGTWNPAEGYRYAKAQEDLALREGRKSSGTLGTIAELGGGFLSGSGLASAGLTASRLLAPNAGLLARSGAAAADATGMGAVAGAAEGNSLSERANNALFGGGAGAVIGGATPGVLRVAGAMASPIVSNISARVNPESYARRQVARAIMESSRTPTQIADDVAQAAREGQNVYTVADAMGNPGRRMLSTVTRSPGQGRTDVVEFLERRQGDQGRRLAYALREGFDAPQTAEQARANMVRAMNERAAVNYAPVKAETKPIDVSRAVAIANRGISPVADNLASKGGAVPTDLAARSAVEAQEAAIRDPIRSALKTARSYLAAENLTVSNVEKAFRAKTNIDQMIATATEQKQGALVAELKPIRDALDEALANVSKNYAKARDAYKLAQQRIDALDLGKEIGSRPVRPEDAIGQFRGLVDDEARQAFRQGYADPHIRDVQNAAFGTNKARNLSSDATRMEFTEFAAPGRAEQLLRSIERENAMFDTRAHALGGSRTADNLADEAAMSADPTIVGNILTGNWGGVIRGTLSAGKNALTGNTPEVRQEVARLLMMRGGNVTPQQMQGILEEAVRHVRAMQNVASSMGRGAAGALAVAPSAAGYR